MPDNTSTPPAEAAAMRPRRLDAYSVFEATHIGVFGDVNPEQRRRIADALQPLVTDEDGTRIGAISMTVQHCVTRPEDDS
ncbi:MAG: hypothetical protein AAFX41_12350 [Bacteroidota bacterium]